jgi:DNA-binding Lrp family transcriptional regulator
VSGVFDGVLYVKARSLKELNDFIWNELSLMDGIKNNQTFINLKTIKEDYDVVL